jgi:large subunit ribosomal protein L3
MKKTLIGKKVGMTQHFLDDGRVVPVTVIELGPNVVVQKKTTEVDGYSALKIGFDDVNEKHLVKPQADDLKKRNIGLKRFQREIECYDDSIVEGAVLTCDIFPEGTVVNVTGTTKGKGFQGVMKRYGFGGGRASHGTSVSHRTVGSIGCRSFPGEVWKGKKMPGRMGSDSVTIKNLKIVKIIKDKNLVLISGAIPGRKDSIVIVKEK